MILSIKYFKQRDAKRYLLTLCFVFLASLTFAQKGVINNGAKMIINSGAVVKISGPDADYTNVTKFGIDGRIELDGKIEIEGNWINNAVTGGVLINTTDRNGEIYFIGNSTQLIGGSRLTFFEKIINGNTSGLNLGANIIVYDSLKLDSGLVAIFDNDLALGIYGRVSGNFDSNKMIVVNGTGRLVKSVGGVGSFTFPVGDTTSVDEYSPVDFTLNSHGGLSSAWVSVHVSDEKLAENTSPDEYLTRYWTLESNGISIPNYDADFHYLQSDVIGTESDIYAAEYDGSSRSVFSVVDDGANVLSVSGMSTFANYTGVDGTPPTVIVTTGEYDPTSANPIPFTVTFSETVTGFDDNINDITVGNGDAGAITGTGSVYYFSVIPDGDGKVTIDIPSGAANDIAGNENTASAQFAIDYDGTRPTVAISTGAISSPTNVTPIPVTVTFSEKVSDFDIDDIEIYLGSKGALSTSVDSTVFGFNLTPAEGNITIDINENVATDSAGNFNEAADQYLITFDSTNPVAVFTSDESVITNLAEFSVTIDFGEAITGFELLDLSNGNCNIGLTPDKLDTSWIITVNPIEDGPVSVGLLGDKVLDLAGNGNIEGTSFAIQYDGTSPTVLIESSESSPTNATTIPLTITFSEPVSGFDMEDIVPANVSLEAMSMTTGDSAIFTLNATTPTGTPITISIGTNVATDEAGNGNVAATPFSLIYDGTNPGILLSNPDDQATGVPVNTNLEIDFDEVVNAGTGFIRLFETGGSEVATFNVESQITGSGTSSIVADPAITLESLTAYHVNIDATAFDDEAGNSFDEISDQTTWNFTTADVNVPVIDSESPDDNAPNVAIDANLQITFNEPIQANALGGYVQIYNSADVLFDEFNVDSEVSIGGSVVDITVPGNFVGETGYYVLIDDTAFQDLTNNYFGGITNKATWNFVTADVTDPTINTIDPVDNAPAVPINSDLVITFDDEVALGSGFITIYNTTLPSVHQSFNVEIDPLVTVDGMSITINPDDFDSETDYYVQIDPTAVDDTSGNSFAGISDATTWNFTTADITDPTAVITYSGADPTNMPFVVTITFNEAVQNFVKGDLSIGNGTASDLSTTNDTVFTTTITPSAQGTVSVILPAGNVQDLAGNSNSLASNPITVDFDNIQPTVSISSGQSGTINANLFVTILFSEEVTGFNTDSITVGNGSVIDLIEQTTGIEWDAEIIPDFDGEVTVGILAGKAKDLAGNENIAASQFSIIYDGAGPAIFSTYPDLGDTDIPANSNLMITFDEFVYEGSGDVYIYESDGTPHTLVNVADITGYGTNTITINPSGLFGSEIDYYVLIDAGAFVDGIGNGFGGIASTTYWTFTSDDIVKPTMISVNPTNGSFDVSVSTNLQITFSEPVFENIGNITIKDDDSGEDKEVINVQGPYVSVLSNVVTIDPYYDLDGSTNYHIIVDESSFRDESNNYFDGILLETDWAFITEDITVPEVVTLTPADDISGVSVTANLEILFTEEVVAIGGMDIVIMNASGPIEHERIDVQSTQVDIVGDEVTINPSVDFNELSSYYVLIDYGAFEDVTGNKYDGITDETIWNFVTEADITSPTVEITSSESGTVTGNFDVVITFSENVTGFASDDVSVGNGTIAGFSETVAGQAWTVTINPTSDGNVTVNVDAGVAQDAAGNDNLAASQFIITYDSGVGIKEITIPYKINIFADRNFIILEFTNEGEYQFNEGKIEVYNLLGQKMLSENIDDFNRFKTKVNNSASQIYVVKVIIDEQTYIKRLFIE
ncbi:MAG: Ig-like domain-containing protein [Bacteroidales bacterium]|nr:Ig-like domain-containing protein [Bacteroidales bacterium]